MSLATIYTLIGHYLSHRPELDIYLKRNRVATTAAIESSRQRQSGLRERLIAKLNSSEARGAPVPASQGQFR